MLLTMRSASSSRIGMRPSACVTSTAIRADECFRTAAATSGRLSRYPLKKLTSDTVRRRVLTPSNGTKSSTRNAPSRCRQTLTTAGLPGCIHGVTPAGKSRSFTTISSPAFSRKAIAARLYASEEHEQMLTSAGDSP